MSNIENESAVSIRDVRQIADLARLRPDEPTLERLTEELNGILVHVRILETLDLSRFDDRVEGASDLVPFRDPDIEPDQLEGGGPGSIAPDWRERFFVVPRLPALDQDSGALEQNKGGLDQVNGELEQSEGGEGGE